jgi:hypothetical protein
MGSSLEASSCRVLGAAHEISSSTPCELPHCRRSRGPVASWLLRSSNPRAIATMIIIIIIRGVDARGRSLHPSSSLRVQFPTFSCSFKHYIIGDEQSCFPEPQSTYHQAATSHNRTRTLHLPTSCALCSRSHRPRATAYPEPPRNRLFARTQEARSAKHTRSHSHPAAYSVAF